MGYTQGIQYQARKPETQLCTVFTQRRAYWWLTPKVCTLPTQPIPAFFIFICIDVY